MLADLRRVTNRVAALWQGGAVKLCGRALAQDRITATYLESPAPTVILRVGLRLNKLMFDAPPPTPNCAREFSPLVFCLPKLRRSKATFAQAPGNYYTVDFGPFSVPVDFWANEAWVRGARF